MIRAYIAGPLSRGGVERNVRRACDISREFAKLGYAIMVPHLSAYFDGNEPQAVNSLSYQQWIAIDLAWVEVSDVLIRITGDSEGADQEVLHAEHCGIPWFCVNSVEDVADVHMQIQNMEEIAI